MIWQTSKTIIYWSDQLVGGFAFAVDLLRYVPGAFYGEVLFPIWVVENSRSTKTDFRGPNHFLREATDVGCISKKSALLY